MPMYTGSLNERMAAAVLSPSAVCASSQTTTPYRSSRRLAACLMNQEYVLIVSGGVCGTVSPRSTGPCSRSP